VVGTGGADGVTPAVGMAGGDTEFVAPDSTVLVLAGGGQGGNGFGAAECPFTSTPGIAQSVSGGLLEPGGGSQGSAGSDEVSGFSGQLVLEW
jgi:hypothetical protein